MRMREYVARMGRKQMIDALRCPYEWHDALKGRKPSCAGNCSECLKEFEFGDETDNLNLTRCVSMLSATKMARALRCPFDWYKPLLDKKSVCEYGEDCNKCIQQFLIGRDTDDFKPVK